ncbi:Gluconate 2-dehydrogenase cytochrome c subunit precursor [Variovorax sp. SRS16]|uniref:c-type cytochrome n=1 Tax=Variovorax sp. SRS16 TaxID=282217 RepID=UPI0013178E5C|nr:cytochrome c [Variovorax sp. SRS16]VTU17594.1 Gluconate 2-dehydrogenase cytochrome c subunit precursor [Variovorax sp. SRS16]
MIGLSPSPRALQGMALVAACVVLPALAQDKPADGLLERGRYLAQAGDCVSCHTVPGGAPFAGGLKMKTPFGTIVSTNITPDPQGGIGDYSEADFARAVREGVGKGGFHLYPAMPYPSFARIRDDDMHALYTFFQKGVKPVAEKAPPTHLRFPFNMRFLMVGWNWLYLDKRVYVDDSARSAEWNRGAYLVQGLGHCGDCHTPRSIAGGVKAQSEKDGDAYLSGTIIDGWYAQPLRHTGQPSVSQWTTEQIVNYLQSGRTGETAAFGPMVQVVENSTQHMSKEDLSAVATYLQSVGARPDAPPAVTQASVLAAAVNHPSTKALQAGAITGNSGAMVYMNNCAACHRASGIGAEKTFPALAGNSVVNVKDPTSLIRLVLGGSAMASTVQAPSAIAMPDFGWRLTDANVADVLNFVRSSWGNQGDAVSAAQVAAVRKALPQPVAAKTP